jgi:hypothetical protein
MRRSLDKADTNARGQERGYALLTGSANVIKDIRITFNQSMGEGEACQDSHQMSIGSWRLWVDPLPGVAAGMWSPRLCPPRKHSRISHQTPYDDGDEHWLPVREVAIKDDCLPYSHFLPYTSGIHRVCQRHQMNKE